MELFNSLLYMLSQMAPYILLGFLIAGLMHAFIPQRLMARHLAGTGTGSVIKAAMIGVPLPLCSCGVLPTAIGMKRTGASKAATTSFLIATPQTGVDSIAATWALLGPAFAIIRPIAALVTSFFGGVAVGKTEKAEPAVARAQQNDTLTHGSFLHKCLDALRYGFIDLVSSIGSWLVAGLVIAAIITVYMPADFFTLFGDYPLLAMIIVLIVAIPMYVCATGSIPIAMSLMLKGLSPGTALVLLMAGPAANFASYTLISREMGRKASMIYIASIIVGAMLFGLAIDYLLPASWFALPGIADMHTCHTPTLSIFELICSSVLAGLLLYSFVKRFTTKHNISGDMTKTYTISGMNCPHCQASVAKAISAVDGVTQVDVNLSTGKATVEGTPDVQAIIEAVRAVGFDAAE